MLPYRDGHCPVFVRLQKPDAEAVLQLGEAWHIRPESGLLQQLSNLLGAERVEVHYA